MKAIDETCKVMGNLFLIGIDFFVLIRHFAFLERDPRTLNERTKPSMSRFITRDLSYPE
jgi:hypothetical protein